MEINHKKYKKVSLSIYYNIQEDKNILCVSLENKDVNLYTDIDNKTASKQSLMLIEAVKLIQKFEENHDI